VRGQGLDFGFSFFNFIFLWILRLAAWRWCIGGGASWKSISALQMNSWRVRDDFYPNAEVLIL
jgi:hypothetical protein